MTFYFYDLETSGFSPKDARIMQFGGQRTDLNLTPVGEPHNILIKLSEDVLPEPDAILITGITPQQTISDGLTEAEFLKIFYEEIALPGTIFVGFNTIRFDDEFMRYMHYRNFYDPYEWQWKDDRSRWDLLDVVRMTRALRPEGIQWPFDSSGAPSNRLELLTGVNKLEHTHAHDALGDVNASIALARMVRTKQPKLFDYLLMMRDKKKVAGLVGSGEPFLYTSGKYDSKWEKTTAVGVISNHPHRQSALVFDLRFDPMDYVKFTPSDLAEAWRRRKDDPGPRLPVKTLQFNRSPAIAPLSVLDKESANRLGLDTKEIMKNFKKLQQADLTKNILAALEILDKKQQARLLEDENDVDTRLYEDFFSDQDRTKMSLIRAATADELAGLNPDFKDQRLKALMPLYKARNFPKTLSGAERETWERFKERKLFGGKEKSRVERYFARIGELENKPNLTSQEQYLLDELKLYGQAILPLSS